MASRPAPVPSEPSSSVPSRVQNGCQGTFGGKEGGRSWRAYGATPHWVSGPMAAPAKGGRLKPRPRWRPESEGESPSLGSRRPAPRIIGLTADGLG